MKIIFGILLFHSLTAFSIAEGDGYTPASSEKGVSVERVSFTYGKRTVPLKVYLPATQKPAPVILLSHGLGGSREVGAYLGNHWAGSGYCVVAMQHIGSDESLWKNTPILGRKKRIAKGANVQTFQDRMNDVPATLDQLEKWNVLAGHFLKGRMDLTKVGMSGHSYGAITTQAVSGQRFGVVGARYLDPRIDAAFAMSPSSPKVGEAEVAFADFKLPALLMTGTNDSSLIGRDSPESRLAVYSAMPKGDKYQLVLDGADHGAFSDHASAKKLKQNLKHHSVIQALSLSFWDAYLLGNKDAVKWMQGKGAKGVLEKGDRWDHK